MRDWFDQNYLFQNYYKKFLFDDEEKYVRTIQTLTAGLADDPTNAAAYNNRAIAYCEMGECEKAAPDFAEAFRLAPNEPIVAWNRQKFNDRNDKDYFLFHEYCGAMLYDDDEEYEQDIQSLTSHLTATPSNAAAYNNRGIAYCEIGEYDRALADFTEAIRLAPDEPVVEFNRQRLLKAMSDQSGHEFSVLGVAQHLRGD
jgi:Flp pilus assembly protein TadD